MSLQHNICFAILATTLSATACVGSPEDDLVDGDLTVPAETLGGPIGANGMNPVDFWAPSTQSALRTLGEDAIEDGEGALVDTPLLDTAARRSVLNYVARCALPAGTALSAGGYTFQGQIGLASAWTERGLTPSEQRWVTACLLQHLNGLNAHVDIVLDGAHPALAAVPGVDISDFTVNDATMFGNVFDPGLVAGYACIDLQIELTCVLDLATPTLQRICGVSPTCGMAFIGLCGLSCSYSNGNPTCSLLLGPTYTQAIRTRVRDTDLLELYPGCGLL